MYCSDITCDSNIAAKWQSPLQFCANYNENNKLHNGSKTTCKILIKIAYAVLSLSSVVAVVVCLVLSAKFLPRRIRLDTFVALKYDEHGPCLSIDAVAISVHYGKCTMHAKTSIHIATASEVPRKMLEVYTTKMTTTTTLDQM